MKFNIVITADGFSERVTEGVIWEEALHDLKSILNDGYLEEEIIIERVQELTVQQFKDFIND